MSNTNIITSEVANRYASALLELVEEGKTVQTVEKDLNALASMFSKGAGVLDVASSPVLANADKANALLALAKKAKLSKLTTNFIGTVASNGRAGEIPSMMSAFNQMLAKRRGTQNALVISAKKLSAAQLKSIGTNLKKSLGHAVVLDSEVDPELLGGFTVKIGSQFFDASLKTKLEGLKLALNEA